VVTRAAISGIQMCWMPRSFPWTGSKERGTRDAEQGRKDAVGEGSHCIMTIRSSTLCAAGRSIPNASVHGPRSRASPATVCASPAAAPRWSSMRNCGHRASVRSTTARDGLPFGSLPMRNCMVSSDGSAAAVADRWMGKSLGTEDRTLAAGASKAGVADRQGWTNQSATDARARESEEDDSMHTGHSPWLLYSFADTWCINA
jgi:hypothetical protein